MVQQMTDNFWQAEARRYYEKKQAGEAGQSRAKAGTLPL